MTIPEYLEHVVVQDRSHVRSNAVSRKAGLFARSGTTVSIWVMLDLLSALLGGLFALYLRLAPTPMGPSGWPHRMVNVFPPISIGYMVLFSLFVVLFAQVYGLYRTQEVRSGLNEQRLTVQAVLTAGLLLCGTLYVAHAIAVSRIAVALAMVLTMGMMMARRVLWRKLRERRFRQGFETRNVLIVGEGRVGQALRNHLVSLQKLGFRFMGFVSLDPGGEASNPQVVGNIRNCVALARALFVDEIYFSTPADRETVIKVVDEARETESRCG